MITAIMTGPNGNTLQPRYERLVFDTLQECQTVLGYTQFAQTLATTVQMAYPNHTLDQIGCGAWDMSNFGEPEAQTQPLTYY